jgi:hypothetical protein
VIIVGTFGLNEEFATAFVCPQQRNIGLLCEFGRDKNHQNRIQIAGHIE